MVDLTGELLKLERILILTALEITKGNKAKAAKLLTLNRSTLVEKMRRHGMELKPPCIKGVRKPRPPKQPRRKPKPEPASPYVWVTK